MRRPAPLPPSDGARDGRPARADRVEPTRVDPVETYPVEMYSTETDPTELDPTEPDPTQTDPIGLGPTAADRITDERFAGDEHDTVPAALPLLPFIASSDAVQDGSEATGESTSDRPDDDEPAVRLRDVWRASRARRKALRADMRRFTVRARRRRTTWIVAAASLVGLVVACVGAAYSPLFAVQQVHVVGVDGPAADEIETALAGQIGTPLPLVDENDVKAALVVFPAVQSYTLEARPPHELVVRVVPRTPIGVVQGEGGWSVVDAAGVVMSTTPDQPEGLPVIDVSAGLSSEAFRSLGQVVRALPDGVHAEVVAASATSRDDVTLSLASGSQVVWGSVDETPLKAIVLESLMQVHPSGSVSVYDVTSPQTAVVR